jgi:GNAT superfamily N-acetyltransferase
MISEYTKADVSNIHYVINNAALKYKGVIPDDCWHEPYMSEQKLLNEFDRGVRMFGYEKDSILVGVMGIQELKDVTLIRHAYTLSTYQGRGIGKLLLQYLFKINNNSILYVGTWQDATWAVKFYEKSGFVMQKRKKTIELLKKYWEVSLKQIENSVVLEK